MPAKIQDTSPSKHTSPVTIGNYDIREDENFLVNRLYYAVPKFEDGQFHCSFFYEENTFRKEPDGDLTLVHTGCGKEVSSFEIL